MVSEIGWIDLRMLAPITWTDFQMRTLLLPFAGLQFVAAALLGFQLYKKTDEGIRLRRLAVSLAVPAIFMLTPASLLIWKIPLLNVIQFPYRWLCVLSLLYGLEAAMILGARPGLVTAGSIAAVTGLICAALFVSQIADDSPFSPIRKRPRVSEYLVRSRIAIQQGDGYFDVGDWIPRTFLFERDLEYQRRPFASLTGGARGAIPAACAASIAVKVWEGDRKLVVADCPVAAIVRFRVAFYPLWKITINGRPATASADENGALQTDVPPGRNLIEIRLRPSPAQLLGAICSILSAVGTVLLLAV